MFELITPRLKLRAVHMGDSAGMFKLWSSEAVCQYSGDVRDYQGQPIPMPASSPAASDKIIEFWQQALVHGWGFRWAMLRKEDHQFVGAVGFNGLAVISEIAYHQMPEFWGQGFMREAVTAALEWRWQVSVPSQTPDQTTRRPSLPYCTAIDAFIEDENGASVRLVEQLGFVPSAEVSDGARRHRLVRADA